MREFNSSCCLAVTILVVTMQGCSKPPVAEIFQTQEVTIATTMLISELNATEDHLVQCPFQIQNQSNEPQVIKLIGTGCSCYGVIHQDEKIERGESISFDANSAIELKIKAQAPMSETLQSYRATFEFPTEGEPEVRKLFCELQVYQDIKVIPKILICDTELGQSVVTDKEITLERIFRSEDGKCLEPKFNNLPNGVEVQSLVQVEDSVELEPGIWKSIWQAKVQIPVAGDLSATGNTSTYAVTFTGTDSEENLSSTAKVIQRVRVPIHYPEEIHFGRFPKGESRKRSLFLSSVAGGNFRLEVNQEQLPDNLDVSIPSEIASKYKVDLTFRGTESGDWNHNLILTTDLENQQEIEIALKAIILKSESN
ncbi:MAG: DUF1573 domain-containing protein [Planctomicrobium sp.]|jgi:hypothetical protein|nr:DUF1573 domain-containing protein [Planctomicrobium sp.]